MKTTASRLLIALAIALLPLAAARAADKSDKSNPAELDKLLIAAQKICPVSGEELDAMGAPVKATSGKQTIFLCCKDCLGKPISKENWAKVTTNMIAAQGQCPVLKKDLPKDAPSIVVNHQRVFVCCKMCLPKVQKDPDKYVAIIDEMLKKNLEKSQHQD
jgi:hypothetical protein